VVEMTGSQGNVHHTLAVFWQPTQECNLLSCPSRGREKNERYFNRIISENVNKGFRRATHISPTIFPHQPPKSS
jgi:hypothetical protein